MLNQRVLTAIVLVPLLGLVLLGGIWFSSLLILVGVVGYSELLRMKGYKYLELPSVAGFALMLIWLLYGAAWIVSFQPGMLLWGVYALLFLTVAVKNRFTYSDMGYIFLSSVYVGLSLHYVNQLRALDGGLLLILFVLFVIWATDIGAFFIGRALKGPKLWPSISPNKTLSGSIGGIVIAALVGTIFSFFLTNTHPITEWMLVSIVISIAGQIGDLVESGIKRSLDVKDSGTILPGHGGVLDRFDSVLFAAPIAFHLLAFIYKF